MTDAATALAKINKNDWVAEARRSFIPSDRSPCAVCGQFGAITQAHHITPLAAQFDHGFVEPCHKHVWLCPTHHAAVHLIISQLDGKRLAASESVSALMDELYSHGHRRVILDLAAFGCANLRAGGLLRMSSFGFT